MLSERQVNYLAELYGSNEAIVQENTLTGLKSIKNKCLEIPYDEFKQGMSISDIRFNWLLTTKSYLAGGAVLDWVMSTHYARDYDWFFTDHESCKMFGLMISNFGFDKILQGDEAHTYRNDAGGILFQLIGENGERADDYFGRGFKPFHTPINTIRRFDMGLSAIAVDINSVYIMTNSIKDIISRSINPLDNDSVIFQSRIRKYIDKGFYSDDPYNRR